MEDFVGYLLVAIMVFIFTILIDTIIYLPASLYAEARCIEAGYPKGVITWNLNAYCISIDGSTRTEVNKLK
jgi:hypothetical protein